MGIGDQVPPAIEQLGAKVRDDRAEMLAWGDLSRYDVIVTGVRAYERRDDLRANNRRLLDYVRRGGTLIVQYNKFEFNQAQYGPYPGEGELEPRHRRECAGEGARARPPGVHAAEPHRPTPRGRTGCRSAGCTSSARRIRAITTSSAWKIRFRSTRAERRRARRGAVRERPMDLRRLESLAPAAGRDGRRVRAAREPAEPSEDVAAGHPGPHGTLSRSWKRL